MAPLRGGPTVWDSPEVRVLTWNLEWARPSGVRSARAQRQIDALDPDVMALTEVHLAALPDDANTIWADADYGYGGPPERRKVGLWSRWGWTDTDAAGAAGMPGGRLVAGTTPTPHGPVRVIGVCIPWHMAHVTSGRKDRSPWEDHLAYLAGLAAIIDADNPEHLLVMGDFNQRLTGRTAPERVHQALLAALGDLTVATADTPAGLDHPPIDHVAHTSGLAVTSVIGISRQADNGAPISDHDGVAVDLVAVDPTP